MNEQLNGTVHIMLHMTLYPPILSLSLSRCSLSAVDESTLKLHAKEIEKSHFGAYKLSPFIWLWKNTKESSEKRGQMCHYVVLSAPVTESNL